MAVVSYRVCPRECLEAGGVSLLADEDLVSQGKRPFCSPHWPHRVSDLICICDNLASCQLYLVVLAAIRDAPDSLTGLAGGIIVLLVAAPRPVPILNTESNQN